MITESVTYVGQKELNAGTENRRSNGWRVVSVTEVRQPVGPKRIAAIGVGAIFVKPKPHYYVVYERDAQPPAQASGGDARVKAQDARNILVDRQGRLRAVEGQISYSWSITEAQMEDLMSNKSLDRKEQEKDFEANLKKFIEVSGSGNLDLHRQQVLAALSTAKNAYSIAAQAGVQLTPLAINVDMESELPTQMADEASKMQQLQQLASAQERVMHALASSLPEIEVRAALADRDNLAAALRRPSAPSAEAEEVPPSSLGSVIDALPRSSSQEGTPPAALPLLQKLAELHEAGVLTDNEFAAKKADLLSRL